MGGYENRVFKNFHTGGRFRKVGFSSDTCGWEAKLEKKLLRFHKKTDAGGRGLNLITARFNLASMQFHMRF